MLLILVAALLLWAAAIIVWRQFFAFGL